MPNLESPIASAERRAWNYWFVDGFSHLVVGLGVLLMALCISYPPHWPPRLVPFVLWLAALVLYLTLFVRHREIVEWLKTKATYPRTGYVQPPFSDDPAEAANLVTLSVAKEAAAPEVEVLRSQRRMTWTTLIVLVVIANVGFTFIQSRWIWSAGGALFAAAMIVGRKQYRLSWILPVGFFVLGACITAFAPPQKGPGYFIASMGVLFAIEGGTKLIRYLLQNPRPEPPPA